ALGTGVGNIPFVPKNAILESDFLMRTNDSGKAGDVFAANGVFLMRHGRRSLLSFLEAFIDFSYVRMVKESYFDCEALEGSCSKCTNADNFGHSVPRNYLARDGLGHKVQHFKGLSFNFSI